MNEQNHELSENKIRAPKQKAPKFQFSVLRQKF